MNRLVPYVAVVALAAALAGCNRGPGANTASNTSGSSAMPSSTTTAPASTTDTSTPSSTTTTTTTSTDVASSTGSSNVVGDTMTTGKVKAAIATDPGLRDAEIIVKTDGGIVVLTGTAKSQDQVTLASNLAQRQEGVSRVDNQVTVK